MNVLLTGGAGYIGSHAAVALEKAGHHALVYDNFSNSNPDAVRQVERIVGHPLTVAHGDVRDTDLLARTIQTHAVDAVIHLAGLKAVGDSVRDPVSYYANNVQGTISLLQAMQTTGLKSLVFSSSATIYGDPQYLPLDERHPTGATNPYGRSKLHIEEMLSDVARSDPAWRIVCLRYFNPVGAHESALIGENPSGVPSNLMPYVAQVAAGRLPCLNVYGDDYPTQDGTGVRDYVHVMDLADGHVAALRFVCQTTGWHAINLGTGRGHSVLEMVQAFEAACGVPVRRHVVARRAGDVASAYARVDKAAQLLGWTAQRGLDEMCASAWRYQRMQSEQIKQEQK